MRPTTVLMRHIYLTNAADEFDAHCRTSGPSTYFGAHYRTLGPITKRNSLNMYLSYSMMSNCPLSNQIPCLADDTAQSHVVIAMHICRNIGTCPRYILNIQNDKHWTAVGWVIFFYPDRLTGAPDQDIT